MYLPISNNGLFETNKELNNLSADEWKWEEHLSLTEPQRIIKYVTMH